MNVLKMKVQYHILIAYKSSFVITEKTSLLEPSCKLWIVGGHSNDSEDDSSVSYKLVLNN